MKIDRDGFVHLSDLKQMSLSPLHYLHRVNTEFEPTPAMQFGTLVDMLLFKTGEPHIWEGRRQGNRWEEFKVTCHGEFIATIDEYSRALACVAAIRSYAPARQLLDGARFQIPLEWETQGVKRRTRGVDILGVGGKVGDLKVTQSTMPVRFAYQARRMHWHAQVADYEDALNQNGIPTDGLFLLGVEPAAPHCVTVLRLTEAAKEEGKRCVASWIEKFKISRDAGVWNGYSQCIEDMDGAEYVFGSDDDDD